VVFTDRIGPMVEAVLQRALGRFSRRFQDRAIHVKAPKMIAAPYPGLTNQAELQGGPPVRAMELQQPHPATLVTEDHQILPQHADPHGHVLQRIRPYHGMPESAQIFSARCARPDVGEFLVFRRDLIV
jgi:hypothetical protein